MYQTNDVNCKALSLQNLLRSNYEAHFPVKKLKYALPCNPYVTATFKKLIRKEINLFKQGRITEANNLRKFLKRKLRKKASEYCNSKVKDLYSNKPKQCYRKSKEIWEKTLLKLIFLSQSPLIR